MSKHLKESYGSSSSLKNREVGFSASLFLFQSKHSFHSYHPVCVCVSLRQLACTTKSNEILVTYSDPLRMMVQYEGKETPPEES